MAAKSSFPYPQPDIQVLPLEEAFKASYPVPPGYPSDSWPPPQAEYLQVYLTEIGCKTVVIEQHYIDHVFMHDDAAFYVRSLRSYPNFTRRLHFFSEQFTEEKWKAKIALAGSGAYVAVQSDLQKSYSGFTVLRPLPGRPVGRTVLPAHSTRAPADSSSVFPPVRRHAVHLAGITLHVDGVPFQQQDHGVSACATTALWSALDSVASVEGLPISSPASITENATRYPLQEGRPFPTEGLTVRQICEATRAAGFAPIVIKGRDFSEDRLQIFSYLESGFAPVLGLVPAKQDEPGHAVCAAGLKLGPLPAQTDPSLKFREKSSGLLGVYIHDDRLGPYAFAQLSGFTDSSGRVRTRIDIEWPDNKPADQGWILHAIVVPVPQKLRLTLARLRRIGLILAQAIGEVIGDNQTILNCRFELARKYAARAYGFGLTNEGLYELTCKTPLSRYVGVAEVAGTAGPIIDVLVDATEAFAEVAVLACVKRAGWPTGEDVVFRTIADFLNAQSIA